MGLVKLWPRVVLVLLLTVCQEAAEHPSLPHPHAFQLLPLQHPLHPAPDLFPTEHPLRSYPQRTEHRRRVASISADEELLLGDGVHPGTASLLPSDEPEREEWNAGRSPEEMRFSFQPTQATRRDEAVLGALAWTSSAVQPGGPPTQKTRRDAAALAEALGCDICRNLVKKLWVEIPLATQYEVLRWLSVGCTLNVRRVLLDAGWNISESTACEGSGSLVDGAVWCLRQDMSKAARELDPDVHSSFSTEREALFLACEQTLGVHGPALAKHIAAWQKSSPGARDERLAITACDHAAKCRNLRIEL